MTDISELEAKHEGLVEEHLPAAHARMTDPTRGFPIPSSIDLTEIIGVLISGDALKQLPKPLLDEMFYPFPVLWVEMPCCGRKGGLTREVFLAPDGLNWSKQDIPCPCGEKGRYVVKYNG